MSEVVLKEVYFKILERDKRKAANEIYKKHAQVAFLGLGSKDLNDVFTLEETLKRFKVKAICDRGTGDIVDLEFSGRDYDIHACKSMFETIAPYVVPNSYIDFVIEDSKFTYLFKDEAVHDIETPDRPGTLEGIYSTAGGCVEYKVYRKRDGKIKIQYWIFNCDKNVWVRSSTFLASEFDNIRDAMTWLGKCLS